MNCALINLLDMAGYVGKEMSSLGQLNIVRLSK